MFVFVQHQSTTQVPRVPHFKRLVIFYGVKLMIISLSPFIQSEY